MVNYETGSAASPADLLGKLKAFALANGWQSTDTAANVDNVSGITLYRGNPITIACGLRTGPTDYMPRGLLQTELITFGCLGVDPASTFNQQPNASPYGHGSNLGPGPFTAYHFYAGDEDGHTYLHATIEVQAGIFRHWVLGELVPYGAVVGGTYSDSVWLADDQYNRNQPYSGGHRYICDSVTPGEGAHLHVDYDGRVNNWVPIRDAGNGDPTRGSGTMRQSSLLRPFLEIGPQTYNTRTPLWPLMYLVNRAAGLKSIVGRMPNFRAVRIDNFAPGQLINIGGDNWHIFPVLSRQAGEVANTVISSGTWGYAHRR